MKKFYIAAFALISFSSFSQCPSALTLSNQTQVDNFLAQYPACTSIAGDVIISGNVSNLNSLSNITVIGGALEIRNANSLITLNGLQNLTSIGTDLIIRSNNSLQSISSLSAVTAVGGELTIRSCNALPDLNGLQSITSVGLGLIIRDNAELSQIYGLQGVTFVGEILEVVENPVLSNIAGLSNVQTIVGGDEGALVIEANDNLTTLNGFGNENTAINGDITISTNNLLFVCAVPAICNYLDNPPAGAVITINANTTGCNTIAQVQTQCGLLSTDYHSTATQTLRIIKNPVQNELAIHNTIPANGRITILDSLGKIVLQDKIQHGVTIIPLNFEAGVYFVKMECEDKTAYSKIVKQ